MSEKTIPGSLPVPAQALTAETKTEALRAWIVDGALHVSLAPEIFEYPGRWGILLVDIARHVSNALHETRGVSADHVLREIRETLDDEWESPTDDHPGELVKS